MTRTEFKEAMMNRETSAALAIYDENTDGLTAVCFGSIDEIVTVEMYFNYLQLKDTEYLYHFVKDGADIYCREAEDTNSAWDYLNA